MAGFGFESNLGLARVFALSGHTRIVIPMVLTGEVYS